VAHDQSFFATKPLRPLSLYNILSDEEMDVSVMNMLGLCQVHISRIEHVTENYFFYSIYKSFVSPGFIMQIMPILFSLCSNSAVGVRVTYFILNDI
jgi:hypothetical protein